MFAVTSRLGLTLMQMAWALPDSTSVGLAQLNAEGNRERVGEVVAALLRMHLLAAGAIACGSIAGNFGVVAAWIGPDLYAGGRVNAAFALDVIVLSMVHALLIPAAVLSPKLRLLVGLVTLLNGGVHIGLAIALGRVWGLLGVALATALSAVITTLPLGVRLISHLTPISPRALVRDILYPWLLRIGPCALSGALLCWLLTVPSVAERWGRHGPLSASLLAGATVGLLYLYGMRPLTRDLPFGPRLRRMLGSLKLV
jgi:hypothetical protein